MFDGLDPVVLARIQFAANITFHILFPTISISLGWVLLYFKLRYGKTGDESWMAAYRFWVKIFALTFALGVVSGITMSFQFGTNWPGYMQNRRQHRRAAAGLRGADRLLPGSHLPRHHAVRHAARQQPHAHHRHAAGGGRHHAVGVLDPRAQFVDADPRRLRDDRRPRPRDELARSHLQPVVPLPPDAHAAGVRADRGLPAGRRLGLPLAARRPWARCHPCRCGPAWCSRRS